MADVPEDDVFMLSGEERDAVFDDLEPPDQESIVTVPDVPATPNKRVVDIIPCRFS